MDLKTGYPFGLLKNGLLTTYPRLQQNLNCEVAIIGGGITGALVAYYLIQEGIDTVLLDERDKKTAKLQKRFRQLFPDIEMEVAYARAGTFGETKDGLAYIGETRDFPTAISRSAMAAMSLPTA